MENRKKIFISYCSKDKKIIEKIKISLNFLREKCDVFCTEYEQLSGGSHLYDELKDNLKDSDYLIAIITDSYIRSPICIAELSVFWAKNGHILPVIYNGDIGKNFLFTIMGNNIIYIDASGKNPQILSQSVEGYLGINFNQQQKASIDAWLGEKQNSPQNPFIGSDLSYKNIFSPCLKDGITKIQNGGISHEELENNLSDKTEIYLVGTTMKGMIAHNIETFSKLLSKGINIYVLTASSSGDYLQDVADIESDGKDVDTQLNRLQSELENNNANLRRIYDDAKRKTTGSVGALCYGSVSTAIRQTITLGISNKGSLWAFCSLTLPPQRAADSLSFEVRANVKNSSFAEALRNHVESLKKFAERHNAIQLISD